MLERLTYANVTATAALFLALGGGAYAATQLPKNSVGPEQLERNAVNSAKVKNHSLSPVDFKAGDLPAGRAGKAGAQGPKGDPGPRGEPGPSGATNVLTRYGTEEELASGKALVSYAACEPGEAVTGGGYNFPSGHPVNPSYFIGSDGPSLMEQVSPMKVKYMRPADGAPATGWVVFIENETGSTFTFRAYVMCSSF